MMVPLNATERAAIESLAICVFVPGTRVSQFVRSIHGATQLTEAQRGFLHKVFYEYRRQMNYTDAAASALVEKMRGRGREG